MQHHLMPAKIGISTMRAAYLQIYVAYRLYLKHKIATALVAMMRVCGKHNA